MKTTAPAAEATAALTGVPGMDPEGRAVVHPRSLVRRLARAVTTPLIPDDYVELFAPLRVGSVLRGRVVALRYETADAMTVTIHPGRGWRGHRPGQYTRIGVDVDGVRLWRAYSITSGPGDPTHIDITVKAITGGVVSTHLQRSLQVGQVVQLEQAAGDFVLPDVLPAKALFLTGGSGITPVMGMLRHTVRALDDVVLVHSAPRPEDVIFAAELAELASEGWLTLHQRHTGVDGRLDASEMERLVPDWRERETFACGPLGLLKALQDHWDAAGLAARLHVEQFRPALAEPGEGGTVHLTGLDRDIECDGATPILDAAEEQGVLMPSGCRMGICYGCVVPLREGSVRDLRTGEVTTASPGDGVLVQTCVSSAAGRCDLDL